MAAVSNKTVLYTPLPHTYVSVKHSEVVLAYILESQVRPSSWLLAGGKLTMQDIPEDPPIIFPWDVPKPP